MKSFISVLLCLALLGAMCLPALAQDNARVTMDPFSKKALVNDKALAEQPSQSDAKLIVDRNGKKTMVNNAALAEQSDARVVVGPDGKKTLVNNAALAEQPAQNGARVV